MSASSDIVLPEGAYLIENFLEMMSAERGAAVNTIAAYRKDLHDYLWFLHRLKTSAITAGRSDVSAFMENLKLEG